MFPSDRESRSPWQVERMASIVAVGGKVHQLNRLGIEEGGRANARVGSLMVRRLLVILAVPSLLLISAPSVAYAQDVPISCARLGGQEAAQEAVSRDPSLLPRLDRDGDGVPCEGSVPPPSPSQLGSYLLIGVILVSSGALVLLVIQRRRTRSESETLETRVSRLQNSLTGAAEVVAEIEHEVATRQDLLVKLKNDAERVRALSGLNREQVDAVTQALQGQLVLLEKRSLRGNIILSSIFYILGIASGIVINIFVP